MRTMLLLEVVTPILLKVSPLQAFATLLIEHEQTSIGTWANSQISLLGDYHEVYE